MILRDTFKTAQSIVSLLFFPSKSNWIVKCLLSFKLMSSIIHSYTNRCRQQWFSFSKPLRFCYRSDAQFFKSITLKIKYSLCYIMNMLIIKGVYIKQPCCINIALPPINFLTTYKQFYDRLGLVGNACISRAGGRSRVQFSLVCVYLWTCL